MNLKVSRRFEEKKNYNIKKYLITGQVHWYFSLYLSIVDFWFWAKNAGMKKKAVFLVLFIKYL